MTPRKHRPRRQPPRRAPRSRRVGPHVYPEGWRPDDWLVPFEGDEHACIHHGHEDPEDHTLCRPSIFCCLKAAAMYMDLKPESAEARAEWQLTEAAHIATWTEPSDRGSGVNVLLLLLRPRPARWAAGHRPGARRSAPGTLSARAVGAVRGEGGAVALRKDDPRCITM